MILFIFPGFRQIVQSFRFFAKKQVHKLDRMIEKRALQAKGSNIREEAIKKREEETHIVYGLGHNTIFPRMYSSKIDSPNIAKLISNYYSWGQPIVIDFVSEI